MSEKQQPLNGYILLVLGMRNQQDQVDCSQSPYFSVGFSRTVRFDGIAAILVCKSERDLGRVPKLPRGAGMGVSIVGEGKRKNRGTVTASHHFAFKRPVAPATATLHWSIRQ